MLRVVTSLLAPPLCSICGAACDAEHALCTGCDRRLARLPATRGRVLGGIEIVSAAPYEGIARELVQRLKFAARLTLAEVAADRMVRAWGATRSGWLVPVPPSPSRERARGFDDAAILARLVARECADARVCSCLAREDGPRQVGRARAERTADPPRVRLIGPGAPAPDGDVWLVDDVATTGATLAACASALRESGVDEVRALTFARADA
jgi:ComF family protein